MWVRELTGPPGAPVVVLLHGWMATADLNWFTSYRALGHHFRVLAVDHRGHGRGLRSARPFRLERCADDVAALLDVLEIDKAIAVGYSMGGPIAQLLWKLHPEKVEGLVLCATSRRFSSSDPRQRAFFGGMLGVATAARVAPGPVRRRLVAEIAGRRTGAGPLGQWATDEISRHDPAEVLQAGWAIGNFDSRAWIGDVDVPTAVVLTRRDNLVSPFYQQQLADSIPDARVFPVEGSHVACVEDAGRFVPALRDACLDVSRRARARLATTARL
jgi:3-oxoadipate enol-lactonase